MKMVLRALINFLSRGLLVVGVAGSGQTAKSTTKRGYSPSNHPRQHLIAIYFYLTSTQPYRTWPSAPDPRSANGWVDPAERERERERDVIVAIFGSASVAAAFA